MRRRNRQPGHDKENELEMTPLIDVVFLLLIFFVVTIQPLDVIAILDVSRPSPDPDAAPPPERIDDMLTITIHADGITLNNRPFTRAGLERMLLRMARLSQTQTVLIQCMPDSPHRSLIEVLDLCAKAELTNLSVLSLQAEP